jgi:hypothetical protein
VLACQRGQATFLTLRLSQLTGCPKLDGFRSPIVSHLNSLKVTKAGLPRGLVANQSGSRFQVVWTKLSSK